MPQSYSKRFNGHSQEVADFAKVHGFYEAMQHYGLKDAIAFERFLEEATGEKNVGLRALVSPEKPLGQLVYDALIGDRDT